jgi:hypothetical protein
MTTKSAPNLQSTGTAAPNASGDCCSNKNRIESLLETSKVSDRDAREKIAATKTADSCCCGSNEDAKADYLPI